MPSSRPRGLVFVSYSHDDGPRVTPLIDALGRRFNAWSDRNIPSNDLWRRTLTEQIDSARCVVVLWTVSSVEKEFVWSEVQRAAGRGVIVAAKLDHAAVIPLGFDQRQYVDLTSWDGRSTKGLEEFFDRVGRMIRRRPRRSLGFPPLAANDWVLTKSIEDTGELRKLTGQIKTLAGVLISQRGPVADVLGALDQVDRTYRAVSNAIARFIRPAIDSGRIRSSPYLIMEGGALMRTVAANRGHCARILEYYTRVGGVREWLATRLDSTQLQAADEAFAKLGTADGDLFASLANVVDVLTDEASAITGLLISGQTVFARKRILQGREKLVPLQHSLTVAMKELQEVEGSLGYVPAERSRRPK